MRVEKIVESLCHKYRTRNPFEIASCKNIEVIFEPLGGVRGYYSQSYRYKMIHINNNMEPEKQYFTCAHELGHALLHPNSNTMYLQTNTLYCVNKFENEANFFAVDLLISDDDLLEFKTFSIPEIATAFCLDEGLIVHRLKSMPK